jgi:DNA-binding CsgD family transcriptional regulator
LRRQGRRVDARVQLRAANELLTAIGANAFAERAQRELLATGERARRRTDDTRNQLTPQESRIASLAVDGLSNPEIGGRLFVSPRTVEYHLHKVFTKLDIRSRAELHLVLGPGWTTTQAATRRGRLDESGGDVRWASSVRDQARLRVPNGQGDAGDLQCPGPKDKALARPK